MLRDNDGAELENPANQAIAGANLVSGWAFTGNHEPVTVRPRIDGVTQDHFMIPCCGPRQDVQAAVPGAPLETSFAGLINYGALSLGEHLIGVEISAPGCETVIDVTPTLTAGTDSTIIAIDFLANIMPLLLADDNTPPAAGNVKVRLVHGAPSAGTVDVYMTAAGADLPHMPTLTFSLGEDSGYLEVPAGDYQVRVTPAGDPTTIALDTGSLTLSAGQIRTAVAVDNEGGGAPFGVVLLEDLN